MATIWDETKKQTAKMKGRPKKEIAGYIWEYYKVHIIIFVISVFIIVSILKTIITAKDIGLGVVLINAVPLEYSTDYSDWKDDLTTLTQIDTKKYEVSIDDTISLGQSSATADSAYSSSQKLAALMSSKSIDIFVADSVIFERYAQLECLSDLREILPADLYSAYEEASLIYYTDLATIGDYDNDEVDDVNSLQASYVVNHKDPSSMKEPVPVGIYVTETNRIYGKGIYLYTDTQDNYQGYPQSAIIGIAINTPRPEEAVQALQYFVR